MHFIAISLVPRPPLYSDARIGKAIFFWLHTIFVPEVCITRSMRSWYKAIPIYMLVSGLTQPCGRAGCYAVRQEAAT